MIKCEAYLMNRNQKAGIKDICGAPAKVAYYDCCANYHGTPMCEECAAFDQRETYSCEDAEIVPLAV